MNAVSSVMTFASTIVAIPSPIAREIALNIDFPPRASSLMRSKITMLASAATPIVRISPAIPGSVSVIGISLMSAKKSTP